MTERDPDPTISDLPDDPGEPIDGDGEGDEGAPDVDSEEVPT